MRKPIVAGNWKMNKTSDEAEALARSIVDGVGDETAVDVVICPPFTALDRVGKVLSGSQVRLGSQHMHWEQEGAFTGEISVAMLLTCGCDYVILGHSERRQFFGETDETVNRRLKVALASDLSPIVCVGETLDERNKGVTESVVSTQVSGAFEGLSADDARKTVVAYEPVWAIGTGETASPEQAQDVHATIRGSLAGLFSDSVAQVIRIQYGGSVKPDNAIDLFGRPDIDGGLIGGASLEASSFVAIVKAAK